MLRSSRCGLNLPGDAVRGQDVARAVKLGRSPRQASVGSRSDRIEVWRDGRSSPSCWTSMTSPRKGAR